MSLPSLFLIRMATILSRNNSFLMFSNIIRADPLLIRAESRSVAKSRLYHSGLKEYVSNNITVTNCLDVKLSKEGHLNRNKW